MPLHDVSSCDQHTGRAVAALQGMLCGKGMTKIGHDLIVIETFDGAHVRAVARDGQRNTGPNGSTVDIDRAGTADSVFAS